MRSLQESINDLFEIDRSPNSMGLFDRNVSPAADVVENENEFTVTCELPGIDQKDIDVSITSNVLTIKGEKKDSHEEKKGKFYKKETWSGSFQRTIALPVDVEKDNISAELKDGMLVITLPKKEESKPKQISVNIK
ncbi:MAG: Hsp20/alpha crystallin family protein [Spirochaetales bacterium]|nr:Hsp20/alpha crystallin family protein [Spirochaetales bacterium]